MHRIHIIKLLEWTSRIKIRDPFYLPFYLVKRASYLHGLLNITYIKDELC